MADYAPGQTALLSLLVADGTGPITTATVTVTVYNPADTAIVTAQAAVHAGNGIYTYAVSATLIVALGTYRVVWTVSGPITLTQSTVFAVDYAQDSLETLLSARQQLARLVEGENDFVLGTVGSISSGGMVDANRIEPKGHWNGAELYLYSGASAGSTFRVVTYDPAVTPAFTTQPTMAGVPASSRYELHKRFRIERVNAAIQDVVRGVQKWAFEPIDDTIVLSGSTFEYAIPAGFDRLYAVEIVMPTGVPIPLAPAAWKTRPGRRLVSIDSQVCWRYSGMTTRLYGLRSVELPLLDSSPIEIPGNYVKFAAGALLAASLATNAQGDPWAAKAQLWAGLAEEQKDFTHRIPNNTKRV